jgi:hypothetical protein
MENRVDFNETMNTCFIKPNVNFPNGSFFDYETCPDWYNSSKKLVRYCCLKIIATKLEDSNMKKIQDWLTYHSSSLLVVPAIIFNLLSFLVLARFSRLSSSATSINFYMQSLCIFDILTMLSKFLHEYIVVKNSIRENPFELNPFVCKLTHFSESVFGITSIYILILMSFDKVICVAFPLKSGSLLRPKRAKILCLIIILATMIYSSYCILNTTIFYENSNSTIGYECISKDINLERTMNIVDNTVRVFVPILLICICNLSIAIALAKARKNAIIMLSDNDHTIRSKLDRKQKDSNINKGNRVNYDARNEEVLLNVPNSSSSSNHIDIQTRLSVCEETSSNSSLKSKSNSSNNNKCCSTLLLSIRGCVCKHENKNSRTSAYKNSTADKNSNYISGIHNVKFNLNSLIFLRV